MFVARRRRKREELRLEGGEKGFGCCHCKQWVPFSKFMGTAHRNHCPFCLWSRHVDLEKPGDRMSQCQAGMKPIGLTFKHEGVDKYGRRRQGELMLIHECTGCGKISINRIAADDSEEAILRVFEESQKLPQRKRDKLKKEGIEALLAESKEEVLTQLYGRFTNS